MDGQEFYEKLLVMTRDERRRLVNIVFDDLAEVGRKRDLMASRLTMDDEARKRLEAMTDDDFRDIVMKARNGMTEPAGWVAEGFMDKVGKIMWSRAKGTEEDE